jgi:hypothetical protein
MAPFKVAPVVVMEVLEDMVRVGAVWVRKFQLVSFPALVQLEQVMDEAMLSLFSTERWEAETEPEGEKTERA